MGAYRERHAYTLGIGATLNFDTDILLENDEELDHVDLEVENNTGSGDITMSVSRVDRKLRATLVEGGTDECSGFITITLVHSIQR